MILQVLEKNIQQIGWQGYSNSILNLFVFLPGRILMVFAAGIPLGEICLTKRNCKTAKSLLQCLKDYSARGPH